MFETLLFDLDDTLYKSTNAMGEHIRFRIISFAASHLGVSFQQAAELRNKNLPLFGTTLGWLRTECGVDDEGVERFFSAVHPENETEYLVFDPDLRPFLISLNMPMAILTNSPREHAERLLRFFRIEDLFVHVSDLRSSQLVGKPDENSYKKALEASGFSLEKTLFIDDQPKYTQGYEHIGGTAILVDEKNQFPENPAERIGSVYELSRVLERNCPKK